MHVKHNSLAQWLAAGAMCLGGLACGQGMEVQGGLEIESQDEALGYLSWHSPDSVPQPGNDFTLFETLQVRPLALSDDGRQLFALNTPDNRLEVFSVKNGRHGRPSLKPMGSVPVGLEPISVAVRDNGDVWVVNHLSDSVSIVKVSGLGRARVVRTLQVGDEPRDIVFGGPDGNLAFITTAHRGQNSGDDPDLFNPATGRADVWVFDADDLGEAPGGERLNKLTFFADTPRALAVSDDGTRVYAAPFFSGNQTTVVSKEAVAAAYAEFVAPDNAFFFLHLGSRQPLTSRVVKYQLGGDGAYHWYDDLGTNFDAWVKVSLPDYDVFTIDASQNPPVAIPEQTYAHAGTTLFNMAVNPVNGKVYVSNTEAHNDVRFEGHNPNMNVTSVRGNIADSRITVLDPDTGSMVHNNLNSHLIDGEGDSSISRAFPQDMAVSDDGSTLLVVAQGSAKLGVYNTAALEDGTSAPSTDNQIQLSAGGPSGVIFDRHEDRAFVLTRFDNGISVVDLNSREESGHIQMFNPEPAKITAGRRFLYDAAFTSENGSQACATCHIGGDLDGLAWDLGNPGGVPIPISQNGDLDTMFTFSPAVISLFVPESVEMFEASLPVKGPMTTQSLRGLDNHGSMHWRGDRNGAVQQDGTPFLNASGDPVVSAQPNAGIFDEVRAFASFNVAFPGLVGRAEQLSEEDMAAFTGFALEMMYPPNPIRALDNSLSPTESAGKAFYYQTNEDGTELPVDRLHNCNGCHTLDPNGNEGVTDHPGFFGTSGKMSFENLAQIFKVAHLRNIYQKVGMFASSPDSNRAFTVIDPLNPALPAVRGFGYQPDGAVGTVEHHMTGRNFIRTTNANAPTGSNPGGFPTFALDAEGDPLPAVDPAGFGLRRAVASFLMVFDNNIKPMVGQQVTYHRHLADSGVADARISAMAARADAGDCDLIAKIYRGGRTQGFVYEAGQFRGDDSRQAPRPEAELKELALNANHALTFTCVPSGSGYRMGIDRNANGVADGDER